MKKMPEEKYGGKPKKTKSPKVSQDRRPKVDMHLPENQILVLIMPEDDYIERLMNVVKQLTHLDGSICYISLNRPYDSLKETFEHGGLDLKDIYFIDAITQTAKIPSTCKECEFVSSPGALTELSVSISKVMDEGKHKFLLFDSLSTLLVYESDTTIAKFVHFLMAKVRVAGCGALFTCLNQDADSVLIKDINMFADRVIHLEKWRLGI
jgi:KaiC/GvpD/RAD55 family RecA-like ATPase